MTNYAILEHSALFEGLSLKEIDNLLVSMKAYQKTYQEHETLIHESTAVDDLGIILSGAAQSYKVNFLGHKIIISEHLPGGYTALLTALSQRRTCPMSIQALEKIEVLFIPYESLFKYYPEQERAHQLFLKNLFDSAAERALELHDRNDCLIMPSIRDKVMMHLKIVTKEAQSNDVYLSFNREELAEYLDVDRSALSRELSRMKQEGLIDFHKNHFIVKQVPYEL